MSRWTLLAFHSLNVISTVWSVDALNSFYRMLLHANFAENLYPLTRERLWWAHPSLFHLINQVKIWVIASDTWPNLKLLGLSDTTRSRWVFTRWRNLDWAVDIIVESVYHQQPELTFVHVVLAFEINYFRSASGSHAFLVHPVDVHPSLLAVKWLLPQF